MGLEESEFPVIADDLEETRRPPGIVSYCPLIPRHWQADANLFSVPWVSVIPDRGLP